MSYEKLRKLQIYSPDWKSDPPFVVMEFVDGDSLEHFQARLPYLLPEVAILFLIEILEALSYAHGKGVIHRDLKPANILVCKNGSLYISDFGLAKIEDVSRLTLSGTLIGSPDYMSPEQAKGDIVEPRSDLFSAGAILYFLITGTRPFSRHSPLATLGAVIECEVETPQKRNPKISLELSRIIQKSLSKNPDDRFQSAEEFKNRLQSYIEGLGLTSDTFNIRSWIQDPNETVFQSLRTIAEKLSAKSSKLIAEKKYSLSQEKLSHLSLVAPESESLFLLIKKHENARRKDSRKKAILYLSPVLILTLISGAILFQILSHPRYSIPVEIPKTTPPTAQTVNPKPIHQPQLLPSKPIQVAKKNVESELKRGKIKFDVPSDVTVYWNGRRVEDHQKLIQQPLGRHKIRLERIGESTIESTVVVKESEPTVIRVR